ncbi:hypothetical protein ES708_29505 [subsurface metagenome]
MCPGWTKSSDLVAGSTTVFIVVALSAAEIPVHTPFFASTDTVKAVENFEVFFLTIKGIFNSSNRLPIIGMQINPLACRVIKLIASVVTFSAAMVRSPSFSLSLSSTMIINLPAFISSIASRILAIAMSPPIDKQRFRFNIILPGSHAPAKNQQLCPVG